MRTVESSEAKPLLARLKYSKNILRRKSAFTASTLNSILDTFESNKRAGERGGRGLGAGEHVAMWVTPDAVLTDAAMESSVLVGFNGLAPLLADQRRVNQNIDLLGVVPRLRVYG